MTPSMPWLLVICLWRTTKHCSSPKNSVCTCKMRNFNFSQAPTSSRTTNRAPDPYTTRYLFTIHVLETCECGKHCWADGDRKCYTRVIYSNVQYWLYSSSTNFPTSSQPLHSSIYTPQSLPATHQLVRRRYWLVIKSETSPPPPITPFYLYLRAANVLR